MALNYDEITKVTLTAMMPVLLDNLFTSTGCTWGIRTKADPGRPWRELFAEMDKLEGEKE